ncbi:hypothetical protein V6U90_10050 [Micromonospora sp. CPCC 206060]|uniref:hypothetical protein n=1 Tax=Micromonospora sp. CPCC 206060 TaxID=3122406 RepID=UPI002FEEFCD8
MAREPWLAERLQEFAQLAGRRITSWTGVEMALREAADGHGAQFADPSVPCLQLLILDATLADGAAVTIGTYQDDTEWGLWLRPTSGDGGDEDHAELAEIFRSRPLTELPTGWIDTVSPLVEHGVLAEVTLYIDGRPLLLIAGEVQESPQDQLLLHRLDESVLVFTDPAAAASLDWIPDRPAGSGEASGGLRTTDAGLSTDGCRTRHTRHR